jgi:hypothetical protein
MTDTQQQNIPWILSKTGVLIMLFVVLGPLGLPFLYKSPAFTKGAKIFWTIAVLIYAVLVVILFIVVLIWMWRFLASHLNV